MPRGAKGAKPVKPKAEATLPVARKSRKEGGSRVGDLENRLAVAQEQQTATAEALQTRNRELSEAYQRQTATAEILRIISSSPTDVQPVFDVMVRSAVKLCDAVFSTVAEVDGDVIRMRAAHGFTAERAASLGRTFHPEAPSAVAIRERRTIHIRDADESPFRRFLQDRGYRSFLSVPVLREGVAIAAIGVGRTEPGPFSVKQIELLKTFATRP